MLSGSCVLAELGIKNILDLSSEESTFSFWKLLDLFQWQHFCAWYFPHTLSKSLCDKFPLNHCTNADQAGLWEPSQPICYKWVLAMAIGRVSQSVSEKKTH